MDTGDEMSLPRLWWTRRLALGALGVFVALGGLWAGWWWDAHRRLEAERSRLRAAGEPVVPEDLNRPPVPDAVNVAYYLEQAALAMAPGVDPPAASIYEWRDELPYPAKWHELAAAAVKANQPVYGWVRKARQHQEVHWGLYFTSANPMIWLTALNGQRNVAVLLADTALYQHFRGDDATALEYVEDVLFQADAIEYQPLVASHLVATGIRALAVYRAQVMATGLTITDDALPTSGPEIKRPARRKDVLALIERLLDDSDQRQGFAQGLGGERALVGAYVTQMTPHSVVMRPQFTRDVLRVMQGQAVALEASRLPDWPAAKARLLTQPELVGDSNADWWRVLNNIPTMLDGVLLVEYRIAFDRRAAAIALAVRLYHHDHGRYPERLDELVPAYLPHVPADPFAADGRPIAYLLAAGGRRPIVYSVGENGVDETPDESVIPSAPQYGWRSTRRDLSAWKDPNPPAELSSDAEDDETE